MPQFRTKARAVDLLGKGQIADLPTAISELWKNGYDAYGDKLEAFLYMKGYKNWDSPIFVLSDDGKGMTNSDILEKWFVLGTDSKTRNEKDKKGPETLNKEPRVKMGEKGIGRLAVAYLGPQMLMLTKKKNSPLEVVFFDWRVLENYDLFLSDINIPLKSISNISVFKSTFDNLRNEFLLNFPEPKINIKDPWSDQLDLKSLIINDCKNLQLPDYLVEEVVAEMINNPTESHGTKFIIFQPDQQIVDLRNFTKNDETEDYKDNVSINYTVSTLAGLFNIFKTNEPEHETSFWIYDKDEAGRYDLLSFRDFFNPTDFENSDHLIKGDFNENGEFTGTVRIYKQEVNHTFRPVRKKGNTSYGPFTIKLGYVQSVEDESMLKGEQKRAFENKLELYSGLFIYRDGFRVLPYGRPDTDFLEFEERRSRSAGEYFFSKRRMFGYIEITREQNEKLKDKSSREGFINNSAFSDFKVDLIAFFRDLAKKYFSTKAENSYKEDQQEEIKNKAWAEKQEHERDIQSRKEFVKRLNSLPEQLEKLLNDYENYINELQSKSNQVEISFSDIAQLLANIEESKVKLSELKIYKPARFKPTDLQRKKYYAYNNSYRKASEKFTESDKVLKKVRNKLKVFELFKEFENKSIFFKNVLDGKFHDIDSKLQNIFSKIHADINNERSLFLSDFDEKYKSIIPSHTDPEEISRSVTLLESVFNDSLERLTNRLYPYLSHLERLSLDVNEDDLVGFYKDRFEEMKEEWNKTYELAQLGIAVEIIDHQFNALYSQLEENIRSLKSNLVPGTTSENKFNSLSVAFEHLQDNYKLLQPLYRTTGRIKSIIKGQDLKDYIEDFFHSRLSENSIELTVTKNGSGWQTNSYESIFKPVLINVVNNALFWLQPVESRKIIIDAIDDELIIMNSGLPIEDYLIEDIFKLFYSERPRGRGIGLYLAKQSLNGIGYDIFASNSKKYNKLNGASFIIKPLN